MVGHVERLYQLGVRGVINMCDEYPGPIDLYKKMGIQQLRVPTLDHFPPSPENIEKCIEFIKLHKAKGQAVYVHCRVGHGRSAAIAFCWLLADKKMEPRQAQQHILSIRNVRTHLYRTPEILSFYETIKNRRL